METQQTIDFDRIANAINFIQQHFKQQPDLEEIAASVHLSPFHFQRLFTEWAGVSPKKFLQYISVEHAKKLLKEGNASVSDAAFDTGLSGTGRLHELFVKIEGMTPGEFRTGGRYLAINYSLDETQFGDVIIASTAKGICYLAFVDTEAAALEALRRSFPNARLTATADHYQQAGLSIFRQNWREPVGVKLHLRGTDFQLKVWEALLKIPAGNLSTYGSVAQAVGRPDAQRAVGTAIGRNPVAFLIPCHRVIRSSGIIGDYMWGASRKKAIIGWEAARRTSNQ